MHKLMLLAMLLLTGAPTGAGSQTPDPDEKRPGIAAQSSGKVTNYQVTDTELVQQAQSFATLRQQPASEHANVIQWIAEHASEVPPAPLYEASRRLWELGRQDEALEWYAFAWMRAIYDAVRCTDTTAPQGVIMLPPIAANVMGSIEGHRPAFGAAGLRAMARPDLFASTVSPWWICSHGIRAVTAGMANSAMAGPAWLKPEHEWDAIRTGLRQQFVTFFTEQGKPQDDPIPKSGTVFPEIQVGEGEIHTYAWVDAERLAFAAAEGRASSRTVLRLWRRDGSIEEIARFSGTWCAGNGVIAYQVKSEPTGGKSRRVTFMVGAAGRWQEQVVDFEGYPRFPRLVHNGSRSWSMATDPTRQSPFDCRWVHNRALSGADGGASWVPLLPTHGAIAFAFPAGRPHGRLLHHATDNALPVELPIPAQDVPAEAVRYFPFKGAYFISPAAWPPKSDEPRPTCISVWWFHPQDSRTEESCVPTDSLHAQVVTYAPSRIGLLRTILHRSTPHGHKPGGVYLTRVERPSEKIYEAMTESMGVAPDGCAVAIVTHTAIVATKLIVLELCRSGLPMVEQ